MAARNCPECGGLVASTINVCPHCGFILNDGISRKSLNRGYKEQSPNPYTSLVWSIVSLVLFWPCGVVSLVYYFKSDTSWQSGDQFYAEQYGKNSITWAKVPLWIMLGCIALIFLCVILALVIDAKGLLCA